ncbi:MAG: fatty acid desaturase family protein [Acidimicrobiales bacterium]
MSASRPSSALPAEIRSRARALSRRDNWQNFLYLGADWAVVVAVVLAAERADWPMVTAAGLVVIGSRQRALANMLHEASHRKLFRTRWLNDYVGELLCADPLFAGLSSYRADHVRHHRELWTQRDPDAVRYRRLGLAVLDYGQRTWRFGVRHILFPFTPAQVPRDIAIGVLNGTRLRRETLRLAAFWFVAGGVVALTGTWKLVVLYWIAPFLSTYQVIRYWAEMAEHAGLSLDNRWLSTRSWTAGWITRSLLAPHADDLYHLAHHLYPSVPHYRLRALHEQLLAVPQYAAGHHCDGFFRARSPDRPSVVEDIRSGGFARGRRLLAADFVIQSLTLKGATT